jgi:hypothetical protein
MCFISSQISENDLTLPLLVINSVLQLQVVFVRLKTKGGISPSNGSEQLVTLRK